ncbi:AraC family transcriptional regulator [Aureimonas mangrovi]|uniref:AraC family transcriptional regulator n=1 Tax=Aureimonas mangrovi TaxID=2758041 RepID=UPI001FE75CE9|nr:helix-turn-helix transcriptional regulator [Aureimonas mangrovi]
MMQHNSSGAEAQNNGWTKPEAAATAQPGAVRLQALDLQTVPRPVAVMTRDYEQTMDFGWHSHRRGQFLKCEDGFLTARILSASFIIPAGYGLLIAPDRPHAVKAHGPVRFSSVYIEPETRPELAWEPARVVNCSPLLSAAIAALLDEPVEYDEGGRGAHLAALILSEIARAREGAFALPEPADRRLQLLCREISADPAIDLDIDGWANRIGMSRRTMTRHFRTETGMSFAEWRRRLRVAHVLRLKAEGGRLEEIAARVGYRSVSALRAVLREAFS